MPSGKRWAALVVLMVGLTTAAAGLFVSSPAASVSAAWTPQPNWPTRAAQTATARASTPKITRTRVPASTRVPATPKPSPTATRISTMTPTPTSTPVPGVHPVPVQGSGLFKEVVARSLDDIKRASPEDYAAYAQHIRLITEGISNWASPDGTVMLAFYNSSLQGRALHWFEGTIVHEAWHVKNFDEGRVAFGCEGEASSLRRQSAYLDKVGERELAAYTRGLIGSWC